MDTRKRFEYASLDCEGGDDTKVISEQLKQMGLEGWEAISVTALPGIVTFWFKREILNEFDNPRQAEKFIRNNR